MRRCPIIGLVITVPNFSHTSRTRRLCLKNTCIRTPYCVVTPYCVIRTDYSVLGALCCQPQQRQATAGTRINVHNLIGEVQAGKRNVPRYSVSQLTERRNSRKIIRYQSMPISEASKVSQHQPTRWLALTAPNSIAKPKLFFGPAHCCRASPLRQLPTSPNPRTQHGI